MKIVAHIVLFIYVTFLLTPTIIRVIEKSTDTAVSYNFFEEEQSQKEFKAIFCSEIAFETFHLSELTSSLILSENLSKHEVIASSIFITPPEQV